MTTHYGARVIVFFVIFLCVRRAVGVGWMFLYLLTRFVHLLMSSMWSENICQHSVFFCDIVRRLYPALYVYWRCGIFDVLANFRYGLYRHRSDASHAAPSFAYIHARPSLKLPTGVIEFNSSMRVYNFSGRILWPRSSWSCNHLVSDM